MRNEDGVEHARIFRLEEVVFEYRPYYRVELSSSGVIEDGMGAGPGPMLAPSPGATTGSTTMASSAPVAPTVDVTDEASPSPSAPAPSASSASPSSSSSTSSLDETFEVVESATINVDDAEAEVVAGNGSRRGLFGR